MEEAPTPVKVGSKKPDSKRVEQVKANKILREDNNNYVKD